MVNIDDIRRWYDDKHKQGGTDTWRPLEAYLVFLELLNVKKNKRILDIGCGTGYFLKLADRLGLETSGIDVSNEAVAISRNNSPKSTIKVGQAENLKFTSNMFDYVVCIGALEHFIDMSKSLAEMYRVGDSKAKYCIVVPNKNFIYWKLSFKQGTEQQDINENIFSKTEWESLFKSSGFKIKSTYSSGVGTFSNLIFLFILLFVNSIVPYLVSFPRGLWR